MTKILRHIFSVDFSFAKNGLTVCVTCAGAGTAKPSNQKNAKVCETAWDVRRIPSVRCTLCWLALCKTPLLQKEPTQYYQQKLLKPTQKESKFPLQIAHLVIVIDI